MGLRIGVDIGGTFTDLFCVNEETGGIIKAKTLTTPENPAMGVVEAIIKAEITPREVSIFIHGTTASTNALIERKCPPVGLICTQGFMDLLDIRRNQREFLFETRWKKPESLVPRKFRREVKERVNWKGEVVVPLNEEDVRNAIAFFKRRGIESYAVFSIFSFLNPIHECRIKQLIDELHPGAHVSLSSEVLPEIREYERMSTTVINAMVKPIMIGYVADLENRLKQLEISAPLHIMKANGGISPARIIGKLAVASLQSGPAGGVAASQHFGEITGSPNILTFDMGGTTTDVSIIHGATPQYTMENELEFGIPIRIPMLDIRSIGAGGGSLGWVDKGGAIRVGPMSAGADPGPACYGRGGDAPTVTDANLVLGRLDPGFFLGGEMPIDKAAAEKALNDKISRHFHWDTVQAAIAIYEISKANTAQLMREMTVNQGYDPRDFKIMSYGGAGSLYAADLARDLGVPQVIIPPNAGVFSAAGCLIADIKFDYVQSYVANLAEMDPDKLKAILRKMKASAERDLETAAFKEVALHYAIDLRYEGEVFEITVPLALTDVEMATEEETIQQTMAFFHREHRRRYSFDRHGEPIEAVSLRLQAVSHAPKPKFEAVRIKTGPSQAYKGQREVYFDDFKDFKATPIYDRMRLGPESSIEGPAVIEDIETSVVVFPDQRAAVDSFGSIFIEGV